MDVLVDNWNNHVLSHIPDSARRFAEKNKMSISASIVLLGIYYLAYEKIAKPPRNLRHLPQVSFLNYIKAIIAKKPHDAIASEITLPVAQQSEQGLYTVFDKTGWAVHIARPEAAKKFLNKTNIFVKVNRAAEMQVKQKRRTLNENKTSDILEREKDLLTLLIEAGDESGKSLTDEELLSNLCVFFTAGHDTTANALSFAAYHLAVNQDVQQKAREEVIRVLGDEPKDILPTQEQFQQMPYVNQIIKEVLRFNGPAANLVVRQTEEDTDLAGVFIPKGARVNLNIYGLHHNPTVWKDPEVFNPDRFAPGGVADRAGLSWLPFSSGGRQCIGMNFSLAEQRVLLPMLLRKYEFSLPKDTIHKDKLVMNNSDVLSPQKLFIDFKKRY